MTGAKREYIKRSAAAAAALILILALCTPSAYAAPLVLKDVEKGIGTESDTVSPERDRTMRDGTIIYGMTPVYPEDFKEGTYDVEALSTSQYFKITDAKITNDGRKLKAVITLSSTSYAYVYPGTAEEAAGADKSEWIAADESTGYGQFTLEAEALNYEMPCAAYSKKKDRWYDRDIAFMADSLPDDALFIDLSDGGGTIADTQEAAMKVIYIALAIIVIGGVLNHFVKKRFYE